MGIFSHCKSLERVDGLSLCKEVGPCCFEHSGIKELDLRRCFDIGHSAFLDSGLRKIKLSGNLNCIGANAFKGVKNNLFDRFVIEFYGDRNTFKNIIVYNGNESFLNAKVKFMDESE